MPSSIEIRHLTKRYRRLTALDDVSLTIRHVVVGAGVESGDTVFNGILGGQDEHRQGRFAGADVAQDLNARSAGQHQVEDDRVIVDHLRLRAGLAAFVQDVDGVPFLEQSLFDEARDLSVVLDHQNAHGLISSDAPGARHGAVYCPACRSGTPGTVAYFFSWTFTAVAMFCFASVL